MYLESIQIQNFRKFGDKNNIVNFVEPQKMKSADNTEVAASSTIVSASTTLIIGKNNTGKTTIANALKLICENKQPKASDFNIQYLNTLFKQYKLDIDSNKTLPELIFNLTAKIDMCESDLMTNLSMFVTLDNAANKVADIKIKIKIEITEATAFLNAVKNLIEKAKEKKLNSIEERELFYKLLDQKSDILNLQGNKHLFKISFFNNDNNEVPKFNLKNLINLQEIKANRHLKEGVLRDIFNKIIRFQFDSDTRSKQALEEELEIINSTLTTRVESKNKNVSSVLQEIETKNHVDLKLRGNVTYESIVSNFIKYNFSDDDDYIPEEQFGLGYINLLNIIGEIIRYVDSYQKGSHTMQINMLFIEEPEAFMHPQMQEFFINRIDNAVKKALEIANESTDDPKVLNCQIAITTHSSHIINSKINSSNSFNNINYLYTNNKNAHVVKLTDNIVSGEDEEKNKNLKFIKKHIKYKVSELFFSDAVIFVEGMTEESLLKFYLEKDDALKNYYISIFNINGAHGKVYLPLIKALGIPCLIITDLDIKRAKCEKDIKHKIDDESCNICGHKKGEEDTNEILGKCEYKQSVSLENATTTNATIIKFDSEREKKESLTGIEYLSKDNVHIVFQKDAIQGFFATSLEEAFILTNPNNNILNATLEACKPNIYRKIVGSGGEKNTKELIKHSYELQRKLSNSKSDFSGELLYMSITSDDETMYPKLPNYIIDGFNWLIEKLKQASIHTGEESNDDIAQ